MEKLFWKTTFNLHGVGSLCVLFWAVEWRWDMFGEVGVFLFVLSLFGMQEAKKGMQEVTL